MAVQSLAQLFDLQGKVAIVTGGAMGIGQGIAYRLAEAGAAVTIADLNLDAASKTVDQVISHGGQAIAIQADASKVADAERVMQTTLERFGSIDILVNNAGIFPFSPALDLPEEQWDKVLDINLKGTFFFAQTAARYMVKANKGGRIVNIASIDGFHPTGFLAHYDSSKGAVVMLTKSLALELGRHNITVNAVAPGAILTPGASPAGGVDEEVTKSFLQRIPLGRQGEPDDIGKVVLFLASGAANYITGETIIVDGGYLLS